MQYKASTMTMVLFVKVEVQLLYIYSDTALTVIAKIDQNMVYAIKFSLFSS